MFEDFFEKKKEVYTVRKKRSNLRTYIFRKEYKEFDHRL